MNILLTGELYFQLFLCYKDFLDFYNLNGLKKKENIYN
jgi:hypothetical protein